MRGGRRARRDMPFHKDIPFLFLSHLIYALMRIAVQPYLGPRLEHGLGSIRERLRGVTRYEPGDLVRNVVFLEQIKKTVHADLPGKDTRAVVGHVVILVTTRPEPVRDGVKVDGEGDLDPFRAETDRGWRNGQCCHRRLLAASGTAIS